jgi:hypothetical protein
MPHRAVNREHRMSRLDDDNAFWERMDRRRSWVIRIAFAVLTIAWIIDVADRLGAFR